jgi:solute carrier family 35 protein F1/2
MGVLLLSKDSSSHGSNRGLPSEKNNNFVDSESNTDDTKLSWIGTKRPRPENVESSPPACCSSSTAAEIMKEEEQQWKLSTNLWQSIVYRRGQHTDEKPHVKWRAVLLGQLIALFAASASAASFTLVNFYGIETQFFQMFWMYCLLSLHLLLRNNDRKDNDDTDDDGGSKSFFLPLTRLRLCIPWWIYLCMSSLFDVFPNFLILLSFRYTSLTSTTLLANLSIPSTMLFSRYILAKVFSPRHYVGVCLCILGGSLTVYGDAVMRQDSEQSPTHEAALPSTPYFYFGDMLVVAAAVLYGLGDTVAEYTIKHVDREEYLGMLGLFGMIQTGLAVPLLEEKALLQGVARLPNFQQFQVIGVLIWYAVTQYLYYVLEARFLMSSDATLLNLSLQASNLWVILFSVVAYQVMPSMFFFMAVLLVVTGVFVYEEIITCTVQKQNLATQRQCVEGIDPEGLALLGGAGERPASYEATTALK